MFNLSQTSNKCFSGVTIPDVRIVMRDNGHHVDNSFWSREKTAYSCHVLLTSSVFCIILHEVF